MTKADALARLKSELHWPQYQIDIGERAGFRYEYCGKDLLASYDDYDLWQVDHIVPGGGDHLDNLALSCKLCNFVKRGTDPSKTAKLTQRQDLIDAARNIVKERRKAKEMIFIKTLEAVAAIR